MKKLINKNKLIMSVAVMTMLFLGSCSTMVRTTVDKAANFNSYHTYAWIKPEINTGQNPIYKNELIHRNIHFTVDQEMQNKGLRLDSLAPDLLVQYRTFTEKKFKNYYNVPYSPFYPFPYGWGRMGWGIGWGGYGYPYSGGNGPSGYEYTEGTLVLEFTDNHSHQVIWTGSIEGDVENTKRLNVKVEKAVHAIMKKMPLPDRTPHAVSNQVSLR